MQNITQISHKPRTDTARIPEPSMISLLPKLPSTNSRNQNTNKTNTYPPTQNHLDNYIPTLKTPKINKNNQEYLIKGNDYKIRLVNSLEQQAKTNQFIKKKYASKGYLTETAANLTYNPNQITFEAFNDQHILGTLTLTINSCDSLMANKLYSNEMSILRRNGRKIGELSKFASNPHCSSKKIFATLFHLMYIYGHIIHDVQDAVIEVNPRHAFFYKKLLGFRQIGNERVCKRVNAPAILLHLDMGHMNKQLSSLSRNHNPNSKTIYPHFLSQHEEKRLANELLSRCAANKQRLQNTTCTQSNLTTEVSHFFV